MEILNDNMTELSSKLITDMKNDKIPFKYRCGLLNWRPNCLQRLRRVYLFLITMCTVCIIQTAVSSGYLSSQITTLERRFSLDSYILGLIQSFYNVGFIISVIFVGYFGGHGRIPLWIGIGMLVLSTGTFLFTLPQFISNYKVVSPVKVHNPEMCIEGNVTTATVVKCGSDQLTSWIVKLIFIVAQILIGGGSSPILSLAPIFIDDHVPSTVAPPLIALLYASTALGPVMGFGLGAVMLRYPVDEFSIKGSRPGDHNWVGAWWAGYVCLGILSAMTTIFLFMFPRRIRKIKNSQTSSVFKFFKSRQKKNDEKKSIDNGDGGNVNLSDVAMKFGKNIKDMPKASLALLTNKIFAVVNIAICCEMFLVNGFSSFLPKYIEKEYKVSNITSSLIAGGLIVPAGALGIIAGGLIMHRFQMSTKKSVLFSVVCVILVLACMLVFLFLSCDNPTYAGLYYNVSRPTLNMPETCRKEPCLKNCDPNQFAPVCDERSGVTYVTACHAGCSNFTMDENKKKYFHNCSCIALNSNTTHSVTLKDGECPLKCNSLVPFIVLLTIVVFFTGITQNPLLMVILRSVEKHERSFALAFQFVIIRVLASIPSPIVYGSVIDAACLHWKRVCGDRGDCLVIDLKLLNNNLIGLSIAVKGGAAVAYVALYIILRKLRPKSTETARTTSDFQNAEVSQIVSVPSISQSHSSD